MYCKEHLQGRTGINPGCSRTKQLGQDSAGEARTDGIRGRDHNKWEKHFSKREGPHPDPDWQSTVVSGGEPAQDYKKKKIG